MINLIIKIGLLCVVDAHELATERTHIHSHSHDIDVNRQILGILQHFFPLSARYNSLLATCYISFIPCILVMFIPGFKRASTKMMKLMVPFALGSMLGDILLHIVPELYATEKNAAHASNGIFAGFIVFLLLDKGFRIAYPRLETGSSNNNNNNNHHHHHHSHTNYDTSSDTKYEHEVSEDKTSDQVSVGLTKEQNNSLKISSYLNMMFEFIHKLTDGIALSSAFYSSNRIGILSFIAVLLHEVPHELCDFALKISSGLTFKNAVATELYTSLGSLIGTIIGCCLCELNYHFSSKEHNSKDVIDIIFAVTCGGLLYSGTVGVVPQILESKYNCQKKDTLLTFVQLVCILLGYYLMNILN